MVPYLRKQFPGYPKKFTVCKNQAALRLTDGKGGAIGVNGTPTLGLYAENCSFIANRSFNHGGAFLFENSKATVINSTIAYDTCTNAGGVAFIWATSNVTFINNTIAYNATLASQADGAALKSNQAVNNLTIRNCFFYKNSMTDGLYQDITAEANSNVTAAGSILQGGANANSLLSGGINIIGSALANPGIAGSFNGEYVLPLTDSMSQAINLGDTTGIAGLITVDQRYQPRDFQDGKVDAGAYEMQSVVGIAAGMAGFISPHYLYRFINERISGMVFCQRRRIRTKLGTLCQKRIICPGILCNRLLA